MSAAEEWRPVPGYDGYEVSSLGRVLSHRQRRAHILKTGPTGNGYLGVSLVGPDGKRLMRKIHVLVAAAFIGPRPAGMDIRHLDGNKKRSVVGNLAYGSRSQNVLDTVAHGTHAGARKTHCLNGHPFDEANTYLRPDANKRTCRACRRFALAAYRQRKAFAAANVSERAA